MIRKFATTVAAKIMFSALPLFAICLSTAFAAPAVAQSQPASATQSSPTTQEPAAPPSAQPPATPAPASQEPEDEISSSRRRKARANEYRKWTYDIAAGANLPSGTTKTFVKGGGVLVEGGVTRSYSKYFGFRLDAMWVNLPLRDSALRLAQAGSATDHVYGLTLDPIFFVPMTSRYKLFVLAGPGFFRRSGQITSSTYVPGSECNAFWDWWGTCRNGSVSITNSFLKEGQNEFGYNYGIGLTRKFRGPTELFAEYRYIHGSQDGITTAARPITIGVRW